MRELFRDPDPTRIGYLRSILEEAGIESHVRNQSTAEAGLTSIPLPEFFPALCVVKDEDYDRALEAVRERIKKDSEGSESEIKCPHCGETNPGNFDLCWSCEKSLASTAAES